MGRSHLQTTNGKQREGHSHRALPAVGPRHGRAHGVQVRAVSVGDRILTEDVFSYRQIFLDGRDHSKDADPTWMGYSIGKWEGDTLVVDTAGFNDKSWSPMFRPHTDKFHMIERFRRLDLGHLEIEVTIDDPGAYVKPWTIKRVSNLLPGDEIGEYICAENNQDVEHLVGK